MGGGCAATAAPAYVCEIHDARVQGLCPEKGMTQIRDHLRLPDGHEVQEQHIQRLQNGDSGAERQKLCGRAAKPRRCHRAGQGVCRARKHGETEPGPSVIREGVGGTVPVPVRLTKNVPPGGIQLTAPR